jgi:AbrB family looped-hinge helix DNA binding protein
MKITIDRAGRVVIPKELRRRYHLQPGTELEIAGDARGIRIEPARMEPSLQYKDGILVHHGEDDDLQKQDLDVGAFITSQRAQRDSFLVSEDPE